MNDGTSMHAWLCFTNNELPCPHIRVELACIQTLGGSVSIPFYGKKLERPMAQKGLGARLSADPRVQALENTLVVAKNLACELAVCHT